MTSRREVDKNLNFGYLDLLQITRYVLGTTELPNLHGIGWSSSAAIVQQRTARANTQCPSHEYTKVAVKRARFSFMRSRFARTYSI